MRLISSLMGLVIGEKTFFQGRNHISMLNFFLCCFSWQSSMVDPLSYYGTFTFLGLWCAWLILICLEFGGLLLITIVETHTTLAHEQPVAPPPWTGLLRDRKTCPQVGVFKLWAVSKHSLLFRIFLSFWVAVLPGAAPLNTFFSFNLLLIL